MAPGVWGGGFEANHLASVSQMAPGNKWPKWTYGTGVEGKIGSRISWPRGGYGMTTVWLEEGGGRGIQKRGLLRCTSRSGGVAMARSRVCLVSHPTLPLRSVSSHLVDSARWLSRGDCAWTASKFRSCLDARPGLLLGGMGWVGPKGGGGVGAAPPPPA